LETSWKPGLRTSFQLVHLVGCGLYHSATGYLTTCRQTNLLTACRGYGQRHTLKVGTAKGDYNAQLCWKS